MGSSRDPRVYSPNRFDRGRTGNGLPPDGGSFLNAKFLRNGIVMLVLVLGTVALIYAWFLQPTNTPTKGYSDFLNDIQQGKVTQVTQQDQTLQVAGFDLKSVALTPARLQRYDCVVIATAHRSFPWDEVLEHGKAIVDTRNALRGNKSEKIVRL